MNGEEKDKEWRGVKKIEEDDDSPILVSKKARNNKGSGRRVTVTLMPTKNNISSSADTDIILSKLSKTK